MTLATSPLEKPWIINSMRVLSSSSKMLSFPKISLIFDRMSWLKKHESVSSVCIEEVLAFNAPTMKWCKMKPMSLQRKRMKNLVSSFEE